MTKPKSLVHAKAEIESLSRDYAMMAEEHTKKRNQDGKQMALMMARIRYLRQWIKAEEDGKTFPCRNCVVAEELYKMVRDGKTIEEVKDWLHKASFGTTSRLIDGRVGGCK